MTIFLLRKILFIIVFIVFLPDGMKTSIVTGSSCQQIYMQPPRLGQYCVMDIEVYRNFTNVPQERCMWHCLRNISCQVINYNVVENYCLLGQRPCISLEPDSDFVTIPMTMQDPCVTWVCQDAFPQPLDDIANAVSYEVVPSGRKPNNRIVVARDILNVAKIPGKVHIPVNLGHFAMGGRVLDFSAGIYEILTVSPRCAISWANHDPGSGNTLPNGAIIAGYQNGRPLYVARKGDTHSGDPYRYAAGYYDHIGMEGAVTYGTNVFMFTEMEILVVHG